MTEDQLEQETTDWLAEANISTVSREDRKQ